jgi:uncharacterized lipoprotein YajG
MSRAEFVGLLVVVAAVLLLTACQVPLRTF